MSSFLKFLQGDDKIELRPKEKVKKTNKINQADENYKQKEEKLERSNKNTIKTIDKREQSFLSLIRPKCFEDVEVAITKLEEKREILVDFEGQDLNFIQRMLDFLSGAVFVHNGNIKKIGKQYRYLIKIKKENKTTYEHL